MNGIVKEVSECEGMVSSKRNKVYTIAQLIDALCEAAHCETCMRRRRVLENIYVGKNRMMTDGWRSDRIKSAAAIGN